MKYTIIKTALFLFVLALVVAVFSGCSSSGSPLSTWTVQCQAKAVISATGDTILIEDLDTYIGTDKTPQFYEDWWGIKTYNNGAGYSYYDCWIK